MKKFNELSPETKGLIKVGVSNALIGLAIGSAAVGLTHLATVYGTTKVVIGTVAVGATAYVGYRLYQSESTVAMLLDNVKDGYHAKKESLVK